MSGYSHDQGVLEGIAKQLRDGATALDGVLDGLPEMVDAGASSNVVAAAMRDLMMTGSGLATLLEQRSDNINTTNGAYGDVENNNAGAMRQEQEKPLVERAGGLY